MIYNGITLLIVSITGITGYAAIKLLEKRQYIKAEKAANNQKTIKFFLKGDQ